MSPLRTVCVIIVWLEASSLPLLRVSKFHWIHRVNNHVLACLGWGQITHVPSSLTVIPLTTHS